MSVAASPSEGNAAAPPSLSAMRATAGFALTVRADGGVTRIADLEERGGYRVKFPDAEGGVEAVFLNTGGGMVGGDNYRTELRCDADTSTRIASQAAERVYRTICGPATNDITITLGENARLHWLPQETILFNGAELDRRFTVDVEASATLLMAEAVVFGRAAMGEIVAGGMLRDRWRVRREGRLIYADQLQLSGDIHVQMQESAIGAGAQAFATVLYVAPDAAERGEQLREGIGQASGRRGVSTWNGMLAVRILAPDASTLRADLIPVLEHLARRPMSRVWNC